MAIVVNSPSMLLPIPVVGIEIGPQYATDINNCLTIIDGHNHSPGYGIQINPAGIDIDADLPFNGNNLTDARSLRMRSLLVAPAAITDLNEFYDLNGNAYFIDGLGNHIQITQGGAIAGTPGSITNMVPPASVYYDTGTQTFIFRSAATTPANIDAGYYIFRNNVASSFGLTLLPPAGMTSNFSLTLPSAAPSQLSVMTMDSAGNMGTSLVTQDILAPRPTGSVVMAGGVAISNSSGSFSTSSTTPVAVTNLSVTIDTLGRPIQILLQPVLTSGSVDANTTLLLHMDGSNGSTTFTDVSTSAHPVSAVGTAQVSTAQVKFGTGSLATDFTNAYLAVTGTLSDFAFGTGDFTIDFWVNSSSAPSGSEGMMGNTVNNNVGNAWEMRYNSGSGNIEFQSDDGTQGIGFGNGIINGSFGTWSHIAIQRSSGVLTTYVNGILATTSAFTSNLSELNPLRVGDTVKNAGSINGFYDEVRFSNIARYSGNFTPPIAPYGSASAPSYIGTTATGANANATFTLYRDGVALVPIFLESAVTGGSNLIIDVPPGSINYLDPVIAGTHTYALYAQANGSGSPTALVTDCQLIAFEI